MPFKKWMPLAAAVMLCAPAGCKDPDGPARPWATGEVTGYAPVYNSDNTAKALSLLPPRDMQTPGKALACGAYIVIPDIAARGLHVLDNTHPQSPVKKYFISVPGCSAVSANSSRLYFSNYNDLVVVDLSQLPALKEVARTHNAFKAASYPPYNNVYFECVDTTRGTVIGWIPASLKNPKCRT